MFGLEDKDTFIQVSGTCDAGSHAETVHSSVKAMKTRFINGRIARLYAQSRATQQLNMAFLS